MYTYFQLNVYTYDSITVYTYANKTINMNRRSENMRKVNTLRSEVTTAMIYLLDELEDGTGGDYDGFDSWDIKEAHKLEGQLNSYRAQKIAQFLGRTISKQRHIEICQTQELCLYSL